MPIVSSSRLVSEPSYATKEGKLGVKHHVAISPMWGRDKPMRELNGQECTQWETEE